jgi:hypothetical protein
MSMKDTTPKKKLKILCMHGFVTNKEFMKKQTEFLRKDLDNIAEFIFVDGPFEVPNDMIRDDRVTRNLVGPPRSWIKYNQSRILVDK